jgi:hypothetical protein
MKIGVVAITLVSIAMFCGSARYAVAQSDDDQNPYAEDSKQIAQIRERHLAELKKIPHVVGVATELNDRGEVVLAVEVDKPDHFDEVSGKVPSQIDGFPVDVEVRQHATPPSRANPLDAVLSGSAKPQ